MEHKIAETNARIDVADVLRGLAVMGIILLHSIEHFNFYSFPEEVPFESYVPHRTPPACGLPWFLQI